MLPRAPLEGPLALHNGAESPRAGSPEAELLPLRRQLSGPGKAWRRARPLASWSNKPQDHSSPDRNFVAVHSAPPRPRHVANIKEACEAGLPFLPGVRLPGWRAGMGGAAAGWRRRATRRLALLPGSRRPALPPAAPVCALQAPEAQLPLEAPSLS